MGTSLRGRSPSAPRPRLVGSGVAMRKLCRQIIALGARQCTVLLQGESGTGKELVARLIHVRSPRRDKPFIPVDATTLRDTLFESQLFGLIDNVVVAVPEPSTFALLGLGGAFLFALRRGKKA